MPCKKNSRKRRTKQVVVDQSPLDEVIPKEKPLKICVLIDPINEPREIQLNIDTWKQEVKTLLKCENPLHRSCEYLSQSGYKVTLFSGHNSLTKQLLYNPAATHIAKVTICGPAIILRDSDEGSFTVQDLDKVAEIAENFEIDRSMSKVQARLRNITTKLTDTKKPVWTREPTCNPTWATLQEV